MLKALIIKFVQEIVKYEMSVVVNNLKLNISNFKNGLDVIEELSMLTINNENAKSAPIL